MKNILSFFLFLFLASNAFGQCASSTVTLGLDQFYCAGTPVTLTASVTNTPTGTATYSWTYQGNPILPSPTGGTYTIPANQSGTYGVTVTYGPNCVLNDEVVIGYLSAGSIGNNQIICNNGNPSIINSISNASITSPAVIQYQWQSSLDNVTWTNISGTNSPSYDPPVISQDTYYRRVASIELNNAIICSGNSTSVFVDVLSNFTIDAGNNINTCVGQNITIVPTITGVTGYSPQYTWIGPNNYSSTNSTLSINSIQQNASGQYTLSSTIGNCTIQDQVSIDVIGFTISSNLFNTNGSQIVKCLTSTQTTGTIAISFVTPGNTSNIQNFSITWGDGNTTTLTNNFNASQIHTYQPGSYTLSVLLTSTSGCSQTISYPVFVGSSPSPAALLLFINQANGCVPHPTDYTFSVPSSNVNGTTYTVNWGDGSPTVIYTHPNAPANLSHIFNQTSCGNSVTISGTTYNNVFQPSVITQNPCSVQPQPSAAGLISVGLGPDASFTVLKTTICPNGTIQFNNTSNFGLTIPTGSGASCINTSPYYWVITPANLSGTTYYNVTTGSLGTNNGFPTDETLWTSGTMTPSVQFLLPGLYTIELRVKNPCGLDVATQTICVINPPTSVISPYSNILCSPASVALSSNSILPTCGTTNVPVAYSWTVTNPSGCSSCSNTISSSTLANSNFTFTNNSNSIQTFTVNLSVTPLDPITNLPLSNPGCSNSSSISIQVYPSVQITPLTTCNGTLNWNLNSQVNVPSTFTWQASPNNNVSGESTTLQTSSIINDVLVNTSTSSQSVSYTVNAVSNLGACTATSTFTVNLVQPLVVQPLSNQTICIGGGLSAPLVLTPSGGSGTPTFSWTLNSTTTPVATTASYSPPIFNTVGTYLYTGTVSSGPTGCVQTVGQSATITVVADPTITTQPIGASYCQNASPVNPLSVIATGGTGTFNYQWYSSTTNNNSGGQAISGATNSTFTPPNTSTGLLYYYCVITQIGLNCSVVSATAAITVTPAPIITNQPQNQTICIGGTLNPLNVLFSGGTTNPTYQWYSNTSSANTGGTILTGETNPTLNLPSSLNNASGTTYYYCVINFGTGSGCSVITSTAATITVLADPTFSVQPIISQTICQGGTLANPLTVTVNGGSGTSTYQWYTVNGTNYTNISNSNSANYNPSAYATIGNFTYAVSVTQSVSGCSTTYSTNAEVIVVGDPTVSISTGANYCQNASPVSPLIITASGGASTNYSYQWYSNTTNSNSGGTLIATGTSASFTPPVTTTGTLYYYCLVTITPNSTGCSTSSTTTSITVTPGPAIVNQPISQTICIGGTLNTLSVTYTGGNGTPTYQWYSNTTNANSGGTLISGATLDTYSLPSNSNTIASVTYYYCVINFGAGSGCSIITSNSATISVLADPTFSTQPISTQTICEGGSLTNPLSVVINGGSGTATYQWYTVSGSTFTPISNSNNASYNPPAFPNAGTFNYAVSVSQSVSGCASANSTNAQVIVVADPSVTPPVGANYCQNASPVTPLTVSASLGASSNYSYQWYNGTTSIGGATSSSFTPPVINTGTINYTCQVTIIPAAIGCSTTSSQATIVVTQGPTFLTQPSNQTICIGGALNTLSVTYTGGSGTPSYQWYCNTTATNTGGAPISGAILDTYTLPTGLNNTASNTYYYCVINFGSGSGCSVITSTAATISVLADPTFSVQPIPIQSICEGGSIAGLSVTISGGSGTPTYQWYTVSGGTYSSITSNGTSATYTPPTFTIAGTYNYAVLITQSVSGCASNYSSNATVSVVQDPSVSAPTGANYCQNASPITPLSVIATNGNGSGYTYQWFSSSTNTNSGGNPISNSNSASYTPPVTATGTVYYYCVVTNAPSNSGCSTASNTATIVVTQGPTFLTQPLNQTICIGGTLNALSVTYAGGSGTPSYQWYSNTTAANSGGTPISGAILDTYTLPAGLNNAASTTYFYCVINFGAGSGCSVITSTAATISVLADPTFSVQPIPSQSICEGGSISALTTTLTGGSGTASYQWYTVTSGTYTAITTNGTSATYTPPTFTTAGTYNYAVLITQSVSGCNSTYSANAEVIVVADPVIVTQPIGASYCQNASPVAALTVSASGGFNTNYTYQWYNGTNLIGSATSSSYTPSVLTNGTSNYSCSIGIAPLSSGCSVNSTAAAIVVTAGPAFVNQPISQTVCLDGSFNTLSVSYSGGSGTPTYQWYSNTTSANTGGTAISNANTSSYIVPTTLSSTVGNNYYYCTINFGAGSGCSLISSTVATLTVINDPTFSVQPIPTQSICEGGSIAALTTTLTGGSGTPTYQWYTVNSGTYSAITTNGTSVTYTPLTFTTAGTFNYALLITQSVSGCASTYSANAEVIVVGDPTVSSPTGASYCQNASPVTALSVSAANGINSNYSYQWYNGTNLINGATTSSYIPSLAAIGTLNYTCTVSILPLTSGCSVTSTPAAITVNPAPTFTTQPIPSQTICLNGTLNQLSVVYQNGTGTPTYQWFSNLANSTSGGTIISGATASTYSPPSNAVGTTYYYCVATFSSGGCTAITSTIGTVVILADPTISSQPIPSQSICVGGTIASALTASATGGTGTTSYQWSNSTGAITGATSQTYLPPSYSNTGQYNYTVTITLSGSGCDAMTSNVALIDVVSDPTVSTQPQGTSYCQNGSPVTPLTVAATGGLGTFSYQWYSNTVNNTTSGSLIPLAASSSYTPSVSTVGTTYYYCVITQTGLNCSVTSNTAAIIVNPAPTFATQPIASQTVCVDGTFNALTVVYQNGTGTPTYQWFSNSTSSTSNGTLLPNETNATYTPPSNTVGTTYYYCVATFASGGCSAITSTLATATVVADPTISIQPIPTQSICVGGTIASALTATSINGTGTVSYQWSNSTGSISGATSQTYLPPAFTTVGAYTYLVTITLSGSGCNAAISQNAVIDVVADPVVSVQPISASYCQNGTPVTPLTVGATGGIGTFSYQWYSSNSNSTTGGTILSGATSSTYTPSVTNIGTIYYYCVISQSGLNCSVTSNTAGIIVNQAPAFLTQPISQTICSGGTFNPLSVTYQFGTGVPSYQWYSNSSNSYTGAVAIAGANTSTYQAPSSSTGSNYYFCVISFSFGGCSNISSSISNQVVVADPTITTEPLLNQTICVGGTITNPLSVVVNGGTGITSYQWYQGTNQINNATQSTFLPGSYLNAGMYNYQVNITSTGVGCDALISQQVSVEVLNDPSITTPTPAIYCQNSATVAPLQVSVSGGAGTNNYQWYYSTTNTNTGGVQIAGASTSSYVPSVSVVGTSYYYCIVTQSTPNCSNVSSNAAIQINQPPTISAQPIPSQTLCEGGTPTLLQVSYINGTNSATYQWYVSNTNSNTGGAPILNETSSTYAPPTIAVGSNYYYCVITFQSGGCSTLTSATAQVTVVNDPAINVQPLNAQEICQGNTINSPLNFTYSGGTGNSTIAWYLNATPPVLINGVTTSSFLPVPFNVADTFSYYATLSFDGVGCNSVSTQMAEIVVHPTPYALNLNDTIVVCNHGNLAIPLTASVTSTFIWHTTNNPSVTGESFLNQTSYTIDDSLSNSSTSPQFLTYTVTPTSFPYGCVGPDSIVTVQVQPDVILSMNPAMEICSDSPVNAILTSNIPSTFTWFVSVNNPNVTGESIIPSSNSIVNDVLVNTSTSNQVVVYSVFPISILGQCPGLAQPLVVTVKPPIQLLNPDTLTICSGQNTNINLVANTNVQFNWYASPSLNVLNETTSVIPSSLINDVLVNPTNAVETVTYNVIGTSTANGCSSPVLPLYVVVNPIPELQNVNPITICNGAYLYPVSLQTTVTGGTTNWTVLNNNIGIPSTFGSNTLPGFVATNNTIIIQTGQVSVTPIFTNNSVTCIGVDTTLFINVLPTPSVNPIADIVACNLEQVPLTPVTGPVQNTIFQWINANTNVGLNVSGIGDIPIFVGQNPGTLPITGTVSVAPSITQSNVTCQGTPIDFTITINPSPTLLNNDIEICDGNYTNILLNANISSTFIWNATINQNVYNETTPVQTSAFINDQLTLAGTTAQTVIYNVTPISTPYGCYGNDTTINVLINPLPIVDFTIINPILCDQSLINFQNNSVGPLAYTWAFGDNDSSFLFNPVHEYANFGSYLVTLSAIDQITGCVNQDSQTFIINETPEPDFILSDSLACGSLDVVFNALDLNPTWQYQWDFGDGASSNQFGLAGHQFVTNGCFDVSLVVTTPEGCTSNSTQLSAVCIYPEPMASFSIDDAVISSLAPDVTFFNTSVHADTYLWDFGDNTTSLTQNPNHLYPSDPATYVIILTASNLIGCQDTAALTITVFQDLAIYVPNTFTPDGNEYNQSFLPILTEGFKKETYHLTIFDRWGAIVFESKDYRFGWEGTYKFSEHLPVKNGFFIKDIICPDGTYIWKISVEVLQNGETKEFMGHVNLIR